MADAQILCTKCGAASAEPRLECAKCGGRNARVCGKCGNQNSVAKNFCDQCGQSIASIGPIAPPSQVRPAGVPAPGIPATEIRRLPTPGEAAGGPPPPAVPGAPIPPAQKPAGAPLPPAGKSPGAINAPLDDLWSAPPPPPVASETITRLRRNRWRGALNAFAALAGIAAAAYGIWRVRESFKPEVLVPKLAAQYLEDLRTRDYAKAYAMFSALAQRSCTEKEFEASRDATGWTWSGLQIDYEEPGAMLLSYDLKASGSAPRKDRLLFTLEAGPDGNHWTRPYNWTVMRQVEEAFDKGQADEGLILAQTAATINPRDPMAWGYLCEAAYYRKSPNDAELRCLKALDLARTYGSNLTPKSIYHLHAILADTYHHALHRPDRALDEYAQMLAFPNISPADQCTLLLARSQAYAEISRPGESLADLERGAQLCTDPQDQAYIQRMRESLRAPEAQ